MVMNKEPQDFTLRGDGKKEDIPAESQQGMVMDKNSGRIHFHGRRGFKTIFFKLAFTMCSSLSPESTENEALYTLYTRIKKVAGYWH